MLVGVGALLLAAILASVGVNVYDADDPEAADAGIACLLASIVIAGGVVYSGLRYVRRGR